MNGGGHRSIHPHLPLQFTDFLGNMHPYCSEWQQAPGAGMTARLEEDADTITVANTKRIPINTFYAEIPMNIGLWQEVRDAGIVYYRSLAEANRGHFQHVELD